jgi:hypothetical protein
MARHIDIHQDIEVREHDGPNLLALRDPYRDQLAGLGPEFEEAVVRSDGAGRERLRLLLGTAKDTWYRS